MIIKIRNGQNRLIIKRMVGQNQMSIKKVTRAQRKILGQSHMNPKRMNLENMQQKSMVVPNRMSIKRVIMIQRRINIQSPKIPKLQNAQSRMIIKKEDGLCGKHWIEELSFSSFFCFAATEVLKIKRKITRSIHHLVLVLFFNFIAF